MDYQRPDDVLDAQGRYKTNKKLCKVHKWSFTLYDEPWCSTGIPYAAIPDILHWLCGQPEYNRTFRPGTNEHRQHFQGALVCKEPTDFPSLRRLLGMVKSRFTPMKGSIQSNIEYTSKVDGSTVYDQETGEQMWRELGSVPENFKLNGESLNEMVAQLKEGASFQDMVELNAGAAVRHHAGLERVARAYARPQERVGVRTRCIDGETGTGKSHAVHTFFERPEDVYVKLDGQWWDGYEGQPAVLFDDFHPNEHKIPEMLRWFDKWPVAVNVRGSSRPLKATRFYITTNVPIEHWYEHERRTKPAQYVRNYEALLRRIPEEDRVTVVARVPPNVVIKTFAEFRAFQEEEKRRVETGTAVGPIPNNKMMSQMTPELLMEAMELLWAKRRRQADEEPTGRVPNRVARGEDDDEQYV